MTKHRWKLLIVFGWTFALGGCGDDGGAVGTPADGGHDAVEDAADDSAQDASGDTADSGEDAADDVRPDVPPPDYNLPPGEITFPAKGSTSTETGRGSFNFGVATAATQIEDNNPNVDWQLWTLPEDEGGLGRNEDFIGEASRGYTRRAEDTALVGELGVDTYRFSVEWARVEPTRDNIDQEAVDHYDALIDDLVGRGITPMITLHHFSNPLWVHDPRDARCTEGPSDDNLCGWGPGDATAAIEEIAEHARLLGATYGDRVDDWCTLNEPINYMLAGYGVGVFPPGVTGVLSGFAEQFLPTIANYIRAHVAIYDALKESDTIDADGDGVAASIGLTKGAAYWFPTRDNMHSNNADDVAAAERIDYFYNRLFIDAIVSGGFDTDGDGILEQDQPDWEGKLDWLGVQYYFRAGTTGKNPVFPVVMVSPCIEGFDFGSCVDPADPTHWIPAMEYEYWEPGLGELILSFAEAFPNLPMTVTESGLATEVGERRAEHIVRSLEQIWRAREAGADVRGYFHWSLTDNFEWARGYEPRFGLYTVDYATYERSSTLGSDTYRDIATNRVLTVEQRATWGGLGPMTPEQ